MSDNNGEAQMSTGPTKQKPPPQWTQNSPQWTPPPGGAQNPPPQLAWVKLFFVICFPLLLVFPYFRQLWK
jgi:hypothetical protein